MTITITERAGVCRWCGCTDDHGCALGCSWANRAHTLCSRCAWLDAAVRTRDGRRAIAQAVDDYNVLALGEPR